MELAYCEIFATKQEAMRREAEIKRLTRQEKLSLIEARNHQDNSILIVL